MQPECLFALTLRVNLCLLTSSVSWSMLLSMCWRFWNARILLARSSLAFISGGKCVRGIFCHFRYVCVGVLEM